ALHGIAGALPDLPGTGESVVETGQASLAHWMEAFAAATPALREGHEAVHVIGFRGGALVDRATMVDSRWYFSPLAGATVIRDLGRVALAAAKEAGAAFDPATLTAPGATIEIAGNRLVR